MGGRPSTGLEIDQGTFLALWCQSLLFPASWAALPGMRWTPVGPDEVLVALPFRGSIETATLRFDAHGSALPIAFEADRYREVRHPRLGWRVEYLDWHWRDGLVLPTRLRVQWADEPEPWLELRVESMVPNEPIETHEDRARAAIATATRGA